MSIRTSQNTEQFDEAFAKAQAKFEAAVKATVGQISTRKYNYADISSVIDATLEHLNSEGIAVKQHPSLEYKIVGDELMPFVTVTTRLTYKGQWEESDMSVPALQHGNFDAQSCGSAQTYASRYGLAGILVVRRADDDGLAATGRGTSEQAQDVGRKKAEDLRAKKAQSDPAKGPDQLVCYPSEDGYEVTGMPEVMNDHKELLLLYGKRLYVDGKPGKTIYMTAMQLDSFKHEFCDVRGGIMTSLKAKKIADAAEALAHGNKVG